MATEVILFWIFSFLIVAGGLSVILMANPIFAALSLAATMVGLAALFFVLGAHFIAGVQLIVYAGAVMVLFVMVIMLFDLKKETKAFSRGLLTGALKVGGVGVLAGLIAGSIYMSVDMLSLNPPTPEMLLSPTQQLGILLFTQYVFGFEALGVLLLVVAIGCVALSRSRGGTHASK